MARLAGGSGPVLGAGGPRFKSARPDHEFTEMFEPPRINSTTVSQEMNFTMHSCNRIRIEIFTSSPERSADPRLMSGLAH